MNRKTNKPSKTPKTFSEFIGNLTSPVLSQRKIRRTFITVVLISLLFILIGDNFVYLKQLRNRESLELGDIADKDFFSEIDFRYIDEEGTERLTELRLASVNSIFVRQEEITRKTLEEIEYYRKQFETLSNEGAGLTAFQALGFPFSEEQIRILLKDEAYISILENSYDVVSSMLDKGYFRLLNFYDDPSSTSGVVEIISTESETGLKTTVPTDTLLTKENLQDELELYLEEKNLINGELALTTALIKFFLKENCYYNEKMTAQRRETVLGNISPIFINVDEGEKIIGIGEVVTSHTRQKLDAYWDQLGRFQFLPILKPVTYLTGIFCLAMLLIFYLPIQFENNRNVMLVLWSLPLFILITVLIQNVFIFNRDIFIPLFIPAGLFTLLLSQLITQKKAVIVYALLIALLAFFIARMNSHVFIYTLVTGMAGALVLSGGEKRIDIIKAGLLLGGINFFLTLYLDLIGSVAITNIAVDSVTAFLTGTLYALLVLSLLPLFEHFMNSCTAYRLSELANLNEPILKRLFIQAAGTYVHSINVAYMAEPACEAIGCNSLLARVASYYHDIGKMDQPNYFIENQKDANKHDDLKANLSVAVIKAHVKLGVEKAREMGLPDEVIQIIGQHHGTSVIKYFYDKAEKEIKEKGKSSLNREDYCHYGPRPQSKEAAVVMMADTIEAASRTLKKPSKAKLEKFVWDLIMGRLQSGELNDSGLTLNELEKIKDSFVHVLIGHFHTRIEYPDQKKEGV